MYQTDGRHRAAGVVLRPGVTIFLLAALASTASAQGAAEAVSASCEADVGLNHFYVVLDEETFSAVQGSEFVLDGFAAVDAGLPAFEPPDSTSERLFVRGRSTYLELFRPDNRFGEPVGKVGIGVGVDRFDDLDCVQRVWSERLEGEAGRTRVERQSEDPPVPWYDAIYRPETSLNPDLVLWAAGYRPEFLPWLYPDLPAEETGVARADFLAPRFDPRRLLQDVTGLTVATPKELYHEIARQLEAIGYERTERPDGIVLRGGGWSLTLVEANQDRRGLLAVHFSTTREHAGPDVVHLGSRSRVVFGPNRRATWYFR